MQNIGENIETSQSKVQKKTAERLTELFDVSPNHLRFMKFAMLRGM